MSTFDSAAPAPRGVLYLATFNACERSAIAASPALRQAIRDSDPAAWSAIFGQHQAAQRASTMTAARAASRPPPDEPELRRQHRYGLAILNRELAALAAMQPDSGRNDAAFRLVCRIGRWTHHGIIPRAQLVAAVLDACQRNGLVAEDGRKAVLDTIASGLAQSANDALPALEACHG